uniref:Uncharacterized protein n=1 Tax=Thermodesulfobacterium geofontis TaxID=1295609 RepID=A0A7C4NWD2_9BACT
MLEEFVKSDTTMIKKYIVFCNRCKTRVRVLAKNENEIKTFWVCSCGSTNFIVMGEENETDRSFSKS